MNFSEFKKLLGADPRNRDPETLRARVSSPEFERAAAEAEAFENKLQAALLIPPYPGLLEDVKNISQLPLQRRRWIPLALAASLLIAISTVGIIRNQSHQWDSIEAYLADHYAHDGIAFIEKATNTVSAREISGIMASLNASAGQKLSGRVKFIKYCPTPDGRGAHMVVSTRQGPVTIIFMPETTVIDGETVEFDQMHAYLVNLEHGSAAIIGNRSQAVKSLETMVRNSIKPGPLGT